MADSENEPSLPPLSPSPATSPGGGDANISIQILEPEPDTLVASILHEMQTNNDNNKKDIMFTIPRVPHRLRRGKNDAYEPNIISIGPYHRGNPRLQAMEKKKFEHLNDIFRLDSSIGLEGLIKGLIKELKSLEEGVRKCYTGKFKLTSEEFVQMMLLDSCFIIHHLLQLTKHGKNPSHDLTWIAPLISYDLLLLENQLPFFLVHIVFDIIFPREHSPSVPSLVSLAYEFYCHVTHNKIYEDKKKDSYNDVHPLNPNEPVLHLLQLCHSFILSEFSREKPKSERIESKKGQPDDETRSKKSEEKEEASEIMIPNATVLHEAGIKFKKNKGRGILDVKFKGGVLEIPPLLIDDDTVSLFNNLIALEHCYDYYFKNIPQFTAYFKFMDHIINTVSDVALLQKSGIIEHTFGSEKEVAQLFNQLTRGATINPNNYLSSLYKQVNKYHKTKRHIWGTMFLRRHCSNPLTILSAIGFLFLLSLTFIQSYFSVFAYFRPPP